MTNLTSPTTRPLIVKYTQPFRNGIQPYSLNRHAVGFVLRGTKKIHNGDSCEQIKQGDIFYFPAGNHYIEDIPSADRPFEQIVFYYTSNHLGTILSRLHQTYMMDIANDHSCEKCRESSYITMEGWSATRNFFYSINQYLKEDAFSLDATAETLKMTELIYLLLTHNNGCIKHKILSNVDLAKDQFEQTIYNHIFTDISIANLSHKCNKSLTTFKKEFKRYFFTPPHKWFLKQRLMHSRLLLISTEKSVAEIGIECNFPNTSHFIKLFKKEYMMTPAIYRHTHTSEEA